MTTEEHIEAVRERIKTDPEYAEAISNLLKEYKCIKCGEFGRNKCPHPAYKCYLKFKEENPEDGCD